MELGKLRIVISRIPKTKSQSLSNDSTMATKSFGIGIGLRASNNSGYIFPNSNIMLTFNLNEKFRLEPEFGFYVRNYDIEYDQSTKSSEYKIEVNMLAVNKKDAVGFLFGPKLGYSKYSYLTEFSTGNKYDTNKKTFFIGPVMGIEYHISAHFAIAGEIDILYLKENGLEWGEDEYTAKQFMSEAGLKFHLYF